MSRQELGPTVTALLIGLVGLMVVLLQTVEALSVRLGFVTLTGVLLAYLWIEIMRVRRVHPERWLLNPAVLCSGLTFFMSFGVGNVLFFLPSETLDPLGVAPDATPAMLKLMWLVLLAATGMWLGYWSGLAAFLSNASRRRSFLKLLRKSNQLQAWAVPALVLISFTSRLVSIQLGLFGYSSSYDRLVDMAAVTQYFSLLSGLGKLALVVISLEYYSDRGRLRTRIFFYVVLGLEVGFGLLAGFKSAVAVPFLIVGLCQYLVTNVLPKKWIVFVFIGIFLAYQIIEPFRESRRDDAAFKGTSISEIAGVLMGGVTKDRSTGGDEGAGVLLSLVARSSLAYIGSLGIEFADDSPTMPEGSPDFVQNILYAPLYAWIPRFIWSSKPLGDLGLWYTQAVIGHAASFSSTAMGPVTFLYLAGGSAAVFLGFVFIGISQRLLLFLTQPYIYLSGAVIYLGLLQPVSVIADGFDGLIILLMRDLPLLLILQRILYRRGQIEAVSGAHRGTVCESSTSRVDSVSRSAICVD